jgi:hypothetical protein
MREIRMSRRSQYLYRGSHHTRVVPGGWNRSEAEPDSKSFEIQG